MSTDFRSENDTKYAINSEKLILFRNSTYLQRFFEENLAARQGLSPDLSDVEFNGTGTGVLRGCWYDLTVLVPVVTAWRVSAIRQL